MIRDNEAEHSDQQSISEGKEESSNLINRYKVTTSSATFKLFLIDHLMIQSERYKDYGWDLDFEKIRDNEDDHSDKQSVSEGKGESLNFMILHIFSTSSSGFKLFSIDHLRIQSERYKHYGRYLDFEAIRDNEDDHSDQQSVSEGKDESSNLINRYKVTISLSTKIILDPRMNDSEWTI
jgi:hypothetical protein